MWSVSFILQLGENAIATGLSTFAGSLVITTTPTVKDVEAAAVAAGIAALYTFSKGLGATQKAKNSLNAPRVNV